MLLIGYSRGFPFSSGVKERTFELVFWLSSGTIVIVEGELFSIRRFYIKDSMIKHFNFSTHGFGLHEITEPIREFVLESGVPSGLCTVFIRHTSASLTIQENADPSAKRDLENWLTRLVPEDDPLYTHTSEGPDDMPSHIKAILTATTLSIPVYEGDLVLGTWQGIYLWEHRRRPHKREVVVHLGSDKPPL